jgi:hypothetical protein
VKQWFKETWVLPLILANGVLLGVAIQHSYTKEDTSVVKPIKLSDLPDAPKIPDEVIKIFNELIKVNWDGNKAVVSCNEALSKAAARMGMSKLEITKKRLLDVGPIYREQGFDVQYTEDPKHDGGDTYTFSKPKPRG